jgi:hypothetical protein
MDTYNTTTSNYNRFTTLHTLQFTMARTKSSQFVFTGCCLVTALNTVDSSASVFTYLSATDCLIAPHGRKSWPLTPSRVWPPMVTTRYRRLALASDSEHGPNREHSLQQFLYCCVRVFTAAEACLPSRSLATDVFSGSAIPAFSRHVTIRS